jgi:type 1 glutamine amidotransferase
MMKRMILGMMVAVLCCVSCVSESNQAEPTQPELKQTEPEQEQAKLKVLLIDGQNNHGAWPKTTPMIQQTLELSGRFEVTHTRTPAADNRQADYGKAQPTVEDMPPELQAEWAKWRPDFSQYDVVVSNYNGVLWPDEVRKKFETYMSEGGGLVVLHAANNAFAQWKEYNQMIGVGGWYGRNEKDGPKILWEDGKLVRDASPGVGGAHGARSEVLVVNRNPEHPIMNGLPEKWRHPIDEVYFNMRGPAENITVLATSLANPDDAASVTHHPTLMTLSYGKGRIFHEMLGHDEIAFAGLGLQITLARGTEWAATGKVTLPIGGANELSIEKAATRELKDK